MLLLGKIFIFIITFIFSVMFCALMIYGTYNLVWLLFFALVMLVGRVTDRYHAIIKKHTSKVEIGDIVQVTKNKLVYANYGSIEQIHQTKGYLIKHRGFAAEVTYTWVHPRYVKKIK